MALGLWQASEMGIGGDQHPESGVEGRIQGERAGGPDKRLRVVAQGHLRVRNSGERAIDEWIERTQPHGPVEPGEGLI